jgi:DnaK suppressor protein
MVGVPQLSSRDRRALRTHVLAELIRLDEQVTSLSRSFDDIVDSAELINTDDEHDPEGSTIAFERALVSSLLRQAIDDRAAMRIANDRIAQSGYGVCENCKGFIGVERLLALPSALCCITCARSM